tara:strand:- start:2544 stop:2813 length:270 start_codon:yes stop_codon:yes gene_type:complete
MNTEELIKSLQTQLQLVEDEKKKVREYRRLYYIDYRLKHKNKLNLQRRENYNKNKPPLKEKIIMTDEEKKQHKKEQRRRYYLKNKNKKL